MTRRALALALLAAALAAAGCGNTRRDPARRDVGRHDADRLLVAADAGRGVSRDIVDGEKLALAQAHGKVGKYTINFSSLDEAGGSPGRAPGGGGRGGAHGDGRHARRPR